MTVRVFRLAGIASLSVGLATMPTAIAASAHPSHGPGSFLSASAARAEAALVWVQVRARVPVTLVVQGGGGTSTTKIYNPVMAGSSGFVVGQTGVVATSSDALQVDFSRAKIYAVNRLFEDEFHVRPSRDLFARGTATDPGLNRRLQRCYAFSAPCVFQGSASREFMVVPYTDPRVSALRADDLNIYDHGDPVSVLRVRSPSRGMPTIKVASASAKTHDLGILGFTAPPVKASAHADRVPAHFDSKADSLDQKSKSDLRREPPSLAGGPVVDLVDPDGSAVGMVVGRPGSLRYLPAASVIKTLQSLDITPTGSTFDYDFNLAVGHYFEHHYTDAVTPLRNAVKDYRSAVAVRFLRDATAKQGTAVDMDVGGHAMHMGGMKPAGTAASARSGRAWWANPAVLAPAAAGVALVIALMALLFHRSRGTAGKRTSGIPRPAPINGSAARVGVRRNGGDDGTAFPNKRGSRTPAGDPMRRHRPREAPPPPSREPDAPMRQAGLRTTTNSAESAVVTRRRNPDLGRVFCTSCGQGLRSSDRFCASCGAPAR